MQKMPVVILQCSNYNEEDVYSAMKRGMDLLGGIEQFCTPDEKILLKPNFLAPDAPEKLTTTHPAVFNAIARLFINAGAKVSYGDSPSSSHPMTVARASGIASVAEKLGIPLADFESGEDVHFAEGRQNHQFHVARGVLNCDGLVSVSKMKTHSFTRLTGAIKNQFGCIPGMRKTAYHLKLKDSAHFSRMLVDLNRYLRPRLCVMDGIIAMQGNGPRGGKPYPMNVLLLSPNPAALDAVFSRLVNVDPLTVPAVK